MPSKLEIWRKNRLVRYSVQSLYYFTLADNISHILNYGILPKNAVSKKYLQYSSFANDKVQDRRDKVCIRISNYNSFNLHDLVPLYMCPLTPTLYAVKHRQQEIVHICISANVLTDLGINFAFSDGNAACQETHFYGNLNDLDKVPWEVINSQFWHDIPDGKRKRNAEFLLHPCVQSKWIERLIVNNEDLKNKITSVVVNSNLNIPCVVEHSFFFKNE